MKTIKSKLYAWYNQFYFTITLIALSSYNIFLGISTYQQRFERTSAVADVVLNLVNPDFFLLWSLLALPALLITLLFDPYKRIGFFHVSSSFSYLITGMYLAVTNEAFSWNLFFNFGIIVILMMVNYARTILWEGQKWKTQN